MPEPEYDITATGLRQRVVMRHLRQLAEPAVRTRHVITHTRATITHLTGAAVLGRGGCSRGEAGQRRVTAPPPPALVTLPEV